MSPFADRKYRRQFIWAAQRALWHPMRRMMMDAYNAILIQQFNQIYEAPTAATARTPAGPADA